MELWGSGGVEKGGEEDREREEGATEGGVEVGVEDGGARVGGEEGEDGVWERGGQVNSGEKTRRTAQIGGSVFDEQDTEIEPLWQGSTQALRVDRHTSHLFWGQAALEGISSELSKGHCIDDISNKLTTAAADYEGRETGSVSRERAEGRAEGAYALFLVAGALGELAGVVLHVDEQRLGGVSKGMTREKGDGRGWTGCSDHGRRAHGRCPAGARRGDGAARGGRGCTARCTPGSAASSRGRRCRRAGRARRG